MNNRVLLKEIPASKFHSALFTTFSINLYYFEQQVLPLLASKGVHYISVLADSNMLSTQLNAYCLLSEQRKRNYALNGIHSNGAFHPKIIFLAGESALILLIGSGNLTSSGHGKNLEVWNAIYIDRADDKKLGFVIQAWNYLKGIHSNLGVSSTNKLKSIEENCQLLSSIETIRINAAYDIDSRTKISFLAPNGKDSIFKQLTTLIDRETINNITVMSPYYDTEGSFLHLLNTHFKPKQINIVLQKDFGAMPINMKPANNMHFYYWSDIQIGDFKQPYFHAKNLVLEGETQNYLLSGSANASVAAFGSDKFDMINHEACILYQAHETDFMTSLGLRLNSNSLSLSSFKQTAPLNEAINSGNKNLAFIKSAEKFYDFITVYISAEKELKGANIVLFNAKGKIISENLVDIKTGETSLQVNISHELSLLYCEIFNKFKSVSNKQFIIDINAFEGTNPSPKNRSLNQIRKLIESGNFSTQKIIDYLNTIYKQNEIKTSSIAASSNNDEEEINNIISEEESELLYLSYEEIQQKIKNLDQIKKEKGYIEYKGNRLWDSIFSYLKERREREEQSSIDEEETEDINKSSGRSENKKGKEKKPISKSSHDRLKIKVELFLVKYCKILESKVNNKDAEKPSLIDLSMFLIILEILVHLVSHKEKIEGQDKEENLIQIPFNRKGRSWSKFVIHIIGLFTLWCNQKKGFQEKVSEEYNLKLDLYKKMAFKTSISAISLFSAINNGRRNLIFTTWTKLSLQNSKLSFNSAGIVYKDILDFELFVPKETREEIGEANFEDELDESLNIVNDSKLEKDYYLHPFDGITFIEKEIINPNNNSLRFLKLFNTGYEWDEEIHNFWNGRVYLINESKWLNSRKDNVSIINSVK